MFDERGFKIAKEYDTPDWSPDKAQSEMEQAITALGKDGFVGVYAANDGTAGGAIAAMKGGGRRPEERSRSPVRTPSWPAIQRIVAGEQYMTVYKAIKPEAESRRAAGRRAAAAARSRRSGLGQRRDRQRREGRCRRCSSSRSP